MTLGAYSELEFDLAGALRDKLIAMFADMATAPLTKSDVTYLVAEEQGVYQLFLDDELVYIGKTDAEAGLRKRLIRHAAKIRHRIGLDRARVGFKAIRLFVFTVMDLESELLRDRRPAWNGGGFGSNDPGRERDTTRIKPGNFDDVYPIDLHRPVRIEMGSVRTAEEALGAIRNAVPWKIRSQNAGGRTRRFHPDLVDTEVVFSAQPADAWEALSAMVRQLPPGWQLTGLKSHVILYKEARSYGDYQEVVSS